MAMSAHETPWRPLGVLLVEQGVISEAELETALADQAANEKPLGEILIAHGFSSRPAIQDALAEQAGVMFEPERGFGTGLRGLLARKHRQRKHGDDEPARPQLAVVPPLADAEIEVPRQRVAVAEAPAEARAPSVNLLRPVEVPQPAPLPPPPAAPAQPVQPDVEAQLDELRTAHERTSDELTRIGDALARVQAELAELRAAPPAHAPVVAEPEPRPEPEVKAASEPELGPEEPAPAIVPAVELAHLRYVLAGAAYRIDAYDGPAPIVGERLELDERSFRVVKVAASPLPGDERRCAYLLGD
jgi:hypothetical protein